MFIAALFTIAKVWNQSSTEECMKKCYIYMYYSAIKKNEIILFARK
jgi:hypothetical protein